MVAITIHIYLFQSNCKPSKKAKTSMDDNEENTLDLSHHQLQKWDIKKAVQILRGKILYTQMFLFIYQNKDLFYSIYFIL